MTDYPESDKLSKYGDSISTILEFLDFGGFILASYEDVEGFRDPMLVPASGNQQDLVYRYFNIDPKKLEQERRSMLTALRDMS